MARNRAAVVIRKAHFDRSDAQPVQPAAHGLLLFPACVPLSSTTTRRSFRIGAPRGKELPIHAIVFGPRGRDSAGERQNAVSQHVIVGWIRRVPFRCGPKFPPRNAGEMSRIGIIGPAADMFKAPRKREHAAVRLVGPAPMLVAPDHLLEPGHDGR